MEENVTTTNSAPDTRPSRVPLFLIIFGSIGLLLTIIALIGMAITIRQLHSLYADLALEIPSYQYFLPYLGFMILCLIPLTQLLYGLRLRSIYKSSGSISNRHHKIGILMIIVPIVLPFLAAPLYMLSVINPIYSLVENVNTRPTITVTPTIKPSGESTSSNWKTYRNEEYGFEFTYPSSWEVNHNLNNSIQLKSTQHVPAQGSYPEQNYINKITINVQKVSVTTTLDELLDANYKNMGDLQNPIKEGIKTQKVAGINAYRVAIPGAASYYDEDVLFINGTNGYRISAVGLEHGSGIQEAFDQILSTFKFIEPNSPPTALDYKTYRNQEIGISFNYPNDFTLTEERLTNVSYLNLKNGSEDIRIDIENSSSQNLLSKDPPARQEALGNFLWSYQKSFNYCDAGSCSETAPGYYVKTSGKLISIYLFKQSDTAKAYKMILGTFTVL